MKDIAIDPSDYTKLFTCHEQGDYNTKGFIQFGMFSLSSDYSTVDSNTIYEYDEYTQSNWAFTCAGLYGEGTTIYALVYESYW